MIRRYLIVGMVIALCLSLRVTDVFASSALRFVSPEIIVLDVAREFEIGVVVDSAEPLNAYTLGISFDPARTPIVSMNTAGSLITLWQTQPEIESGGTVRMNGASTVPFSGKNGKLMRIRFRAAEGVESAEFTFLPRTAVYLANGKGTRVFPNAMPLAVHFVPADETPAVPLPLPAEAVFPELGEDSDPPRVTFAVLEADPVTVEQKLFAFVADDGNSGIRTVETRSRSWFLWGNWQNAQNPMAYPHDVWSVELRVTDNAGNAVHRTVYDLPALGPRALTVFLAILAGFVVTRFLRTRRRLA